MHGRVRAENSAAKKSRFLRRLAEIYGATAYTREPAASTAAAKSSAGGVSQAKKGAKAARETP